MKMQKGDLILVDYIGKTNGEIFDLSIEEKAKEEGIHREDVEYKPVPVLIGEDYVIDGFEEAVKQMEIGEEKEVQIEPEKGYGKRDSDKIETYPEKEFKKQDMNVRPGEELMIGNRRGKVISKGSGRVRIDFNHPLAGKTLDYWLKAREKVEDDKEKAQYIYNYRIGHGPTEIEDGVFKIPKTHSHGDHKHELPEQLRNQIKEEIENHTNLEVEYTEEE